MDGIRGRTQGPRAPETTHVQEWLVEQYTLTRAAAAPADTQAAPARPAPDSRRTRREDRVGQGRRGRRSAPPLQGGDGVRRDIQGLRALAVLIVLLFHFWPKRLTGGYVGVDVFFVISGFLISSHLLRSPPVTPSLLAGFWARRVRRLLPAASLVLLATLLASLAWLPSTQIPTVARETIASALSVENWALAATATDYLSQESAPSPLQHYWSLSVEEQFYALWPLLIALLFYVGRRSRPVVWAGSGLALVTGASLAASVHLTQSNPPAAYFVTHTRVWELGLGSLLALAVHLGWRLRHPAVRAALGWLGLGMIAWAAVMFDSATPFPGTAALLPTLGAVLVIAAATDGVRWSPRALLGSRPSQKLGDISYSLYLWHWPVVVIAPFALGGPLQWVQKVALIAAVLIAATVTKTFVEDPARRSRFLVTSKRRSFALALTSALVLCGCGVAVIQQGKATQAAEAQALERGLADGHCVGAAALRDPGCTSITGDDLLSSPLVAKDDREAAYGDGCFTGIPFTKRNTCSYGTPDGDVRVALFGNSHAGHWEPAITPVVQDRGWLLDTFLVFQCYTQAHPIAFTPTKVSDNCVDWNQWAVDSITRGGYDLVVMSNRTSRQLRDVPKADRNRVAEEGYRDTIRAITDSGARVLVIRDNPAAIQQAPDCVASHLADVASCSNDAAKAIEPDPLYAAASKDKSGMVSTLDLSDRFCRDGRCYHVVGDLVAYRDHGHLTTTFARTLTPDVQAAVDQALARRAS
jgi:peptidoglycan/LPS O-acetylase OafA/YrhL